MEGRKVSQTHMDACHNLYHTNYVHTCICKHMFQINFSVERKGAITKD